MRFGYELKTSYELNQSSPSALRHSKVIFEGSDLFEMTYNQAATLHRINLGWRRRKEESQKGFMLDVNSGNWIRNNNEVQVQDDDQDAMGPVQKRVIPYVHDRKNILLFRPNFDIEEIQLITLMYAIKQAVQSIYQLEDNELSVEVLPNFSTPMLIMFYESAEGGAGVLRKITEDPSAIGMIAKEALGICHFDDEGNDLGHAPKSQERCITACYQCLLSYSNQPSHEIIDRHEIVDILLELCNSKVNSSPSALPRGEHLKQLISKSESKLEEKWLKFLEKHALSLPDHSQFSINDPMTRPDFYYEAMRVAIYVDGPPHDYPDRQERDIAQTKEMEDRAFWVIRFHHEDDWMEIVNNHISIFGNPISN
jgi:very-short-patch-repair endonuclease